MTTERKVASRKTAGKKSVPPTKQAGLRTARAFALGVNFGLSSRIRELLDEKKPELQVLIDEKVPLNRIQEYISLNYGPKIGVKALRNYIDGTFTRAAAAPRDAPPKSGAKRRR